MTEEQWRSHPDFPCYKVSNLGSVQTCFKVYRDTLVPLKKARNPVQWPDPDGYLFVTLWHCGKRRAFRVHRLVAELFCNNFKSTFEVHHKDGNRKNNVASNLWCGSREEHIQGVHNLSEDEIDYIDIWCTRTLQLLHNAYSVKHAAKLANITESVVRVALATPNGICGDCPQYKFDRF